MILKLLEDIQFSTRNRKIVRRELKILLLQEYAFFLEEKNIQKNLLVKKQKYIQGY